MRELHNKIKSQYQGTLPDFPPKKWLFNTDADFISQRKKSLEHYFNTILKNIDINTIPALMEFLK